MGLIFASLLYVSAPTAYVVPETPIVQVAVARRVVRRTAARPVRRAVR